jgi:hypothetical protein
MSYIGAHTSQFKQNGRYKIPKEIAKATEQSVEVSRAMLNALVFYITTELAAGRPVYVARLGVFKPIGNRVGTVVKFKPDARVRRAVRFFKKPVDAPEKI